MPVQVRARHCRECIDSIQLKPLEHVEHRVQAALVGPAGPGCTPGAVARRVPSGIEVVDGRLGRNRRDSRCPAQRNTNKTQRLKSNACFWCVRKLVRDRVSHTAVCIRQRCDLDLKLAGEIQRTRRKTWNRRAEGACIKYS